MNSGTSGLRLAPLRAADEAAVIAGQQALSDTDGFTFALGYQPGMAWVSFLSLLEQQHRGDGLPDAMVPATFLGASVGGQLVGRTSIRHHLNRYLELEGGHIGYAVLPGCRRRGYATEILRQSLIIARSAGVDRVLMTCEDANTGSATVIERCGGQLDSVTPVSGRLVRRYWID